MTDTTTKREARCERTDLLIGQCAHCRPNPAGEWLASAILSSAFAIREREPDNYTTSFRIDVTGETPFRANFSSGRCTCCSEHIIRGEFIVASGESRYAHVECP